MTSRLSEKTKAFIVLGTFLLVVFINFLANRLPINNLTTGEVSDQFPVHFTPAGYVFIIWGLIYLLLAIFSVYQALPNQYERPVFKRIRWWLAAANIWNILWIFSWHYLQISLSLFFMILLLLSILFIYVSVEQAGVKQKKQEFITVFLPFSIYLGWACVAAIANLSILALHLGWIGEGMGSAVWSVVMIILGALIAVLVIMTRRDIAFALVFAWAFIGIGARHGADALGVTIVAWLSAAVILVLLGGSIAGGEKVFSAKK